MSNSRAVKQRQGTLLGFFWPCPFTSEAGKINLIDKKDATWWFSCESDRNLKGFIFESSSKDPLKMTRQIQHVTLRASTVTIRRHFHFQVSLSHWKAVWGKILADPTNFPENQFKLFRNLLFWSKLQVKFTSDLYKSSHFTYPQSLTWGFPMFSCFGIISSYTKTHISDTCATGVLWSPKYKLESLQRAKRIIFKIIFLCFFLMFLFWFFLWFYLWFFCFFLMIFFSLKFMNKFMNKFMTLGDPKIIKKNHKKIIKKNH